MCGRYTLSEYEDLSRHFVFKADFARYPPRYNIAPGQEAPVIIADVSFDDAAGEIPASDVTIEIKKVARLMLWGLIPFWAKDRKIGYKLVNARSETLAEKPSFKNALKKRRCLVPADGFYEWHKIEGRKGKLPVRFVMKDERPFLFAGLFETWSDPEGDTLYTFTIITTEANDLVSRFHNRMPVILAREAVDAWLDPAATSRDTLQALLRPYPPGEMDAYPVSTLVNSPKNDSPECIERV